MQSVRIRSLVVGALLSASFCHGSPRFYPDDPLSAEPPPMNTVEARYRATSVGGWGATLEINADRSGNQCAPLYAILNKPDATTQELKIGNRLPSGSWENWLAVLSVPDDFVNVRLVIDPTDDTIAAFVNGVHMGTYTYTWGLNDNGAEGFIYSEGCSGEFDYVRIRVGGSSP